MVTKVLGNRKNEEEALICRLMLAYQDDAFLSFGGSSGSVNMKQITSMISEKFGLDINIKVALKLIARSYWKHMIWTRMGDSNTTISGPC
jgi:hypothetical protein